MDHRCEGDWHWAYPTWLFFKLSFFFWVIELFVTNDVDEVWISSVKRAQLPPLPLLESAASSRMITGVVPATMPPTLKLGIIECNVLKKKMV